MTKYALQTKAVIGAVLLFSAVLQATDKHPLAPTDTSSPRATIESFLEIMQESRALLEKDLYLKSKSSQLQHEQLEEQTEQLFDFRDIPVERVEDVANYVRPLMMEILDRIDLPAKETIPDTEAVEAHTLTQWTIPHTEIALIKINDGPRQGHWVFSTETLKRLKEYYDRIKDHPYRPDAIMGHIEPFGGPYDRHVLLPEESFSYEWIKQLPAWAWAVYVENAVWKWLAVGAILGFATGISILISSAVRRLRRQQNQDDNSLQWFRLLPPVCGAVLALLAEDLIDEQINAVGIVDAFTETGLWCIALVCWAWAIIELGGIGARLFVRRWQKDYRDVHLFIASVVIRVLTLLIAVWIVIYGVERLGLSIMPLLAGLGIGGIAIAMAVRPTLENLIGGIVLLVDKPVEVGDLCSYEVDGGMQIGVVERIGLRSTRLRKYEDTLVTIPNADFCQLQLENLSSRQMTLLQYTLNLRYETSADQLRSVLTYLRKMMIGHPKVSPERLRVRFLGFGDSSLDVEVFAYVRTHDYPEYWAIREDVNLRIIDIVNDAGTAFAFPSQTTYLKRDTGLDDEKTWQSEAEVESWRSEQNLPFPDFKREDRVELTDTLDYPPAGSPQEALTGKRSTPRKIWKWKRHQRPDQE